MFLVLQILFPLFLYKSSPSTKYKNSLNKWNKVKSNSYTYTISFQSWVGYGYKQTAKIKNDIVIEKIYKEYYLNPHYHNDDDILTYFKETGNDIGKHKKGVNPLTIHQIYKQCKQYLTLNDVDNHIYFETNKNGLIKT